MSLQLFKKDVLFYQRFLKSNGFYKKELDGDWGKHTNEADINFNTKSQEIAEIFGRFDLRSESNIITLIPIAQQTARQFLKILTEAGKDVRIISGTRTYAEQDTLYRQGRFGNPGPIVTKARGGQSNHNFGVAWDIGLFENGNYITTDNKYKAISVLVLPPHVLNLEWGGNWVSFPDFPHYQQKTVADKVSQIRALFENGQPYV